MKRLILIIALLVYGAIIACDADTSPVEPMPTIPAGVCRAVGGEQQ